MNVHVEIMTHEPYWYECDRCNFKTAQYESYPALVKAIVAHRHTPTGEVKASAPAPLRPSQVGQGLSNHG